MKFVSGVFVGALLMWLYGSNRARLTRAPDFLQQVGQVAASGASSGAQWASEVIQAAPIPAGVKNTANDVAFNAWATAESLGEQQSKETPHA